MTVFLHDWFGRHHLRPLTTSSWSSGTVLASALCSALLSFFAPPPTRKRATSHVGSPAGIQMTSQTAEQMPWSKNGRARLRLLTMKGRRRHSMVLRPGAELRGGVRAARSGDRARPTHYGNQVAASRVLFSEPACNTREQCIAVSKCRQSRSITPQPTLYS